MHVGVTTWMVNDIDGVTIWSSRENILFQIGSKWIAHLLKFMCTYLNKCAPTKFHHFRPIMQVRSTFLNLSARLSKGKVLRAFLWPKRQEELVFLRNSAINSKKLQNQVLIDHKTAEEHFQFYRIILDEDKNADISQYSAVGGVLMEEIGFQISWFWARSELISIFGGSKNGFEFWNLEETREFPVIRSDIQKLLWMFSIHDKAHFLLRRSLNQSISIGQPTNIVGA